MKRILSFLVAMIMAFGCVGITAMAIEETTAANVEVTDAEGNVTYYAGFEGFKDLELADCVIKLLADVSDANLILNKGTAVDTNVTLDLNGFTFSREGSSSGAINLTQGSQLTICDTSDEKNGKIISDTYAVWIMNGDLWVESGKIETTSTDKVAIYVNAAEVEINGGNIISAGDAISVGENFIESRGASKISISDGVITAGGCGVVEGSYSSAATALNISGGEINSTNECIAMEKGTASITGGTFSKDVSAYVADGFEFVDNGDGTYGVVEVSETPVYVAEVNGTAYATLEEAIAAAALEESATVKILCDTTMSKTDINGNITLDLNGCTVTALDSTAFYLKDGASLTIMDSSEEQDGLLSVANRYPENAIYMTGANTTFTINSGNLYSNNNAITALYTTANVNLNGGSITTNKNTENSSILYIYDIQGIVNITGGIYSGCDFAPFGGNISITGGTFDEDVQNYCARGFTTEKNDDGTFSVVVDVVKNPKAKIGDTEFSSVASALSYAKENAMTDVTITLVGETTADTKDSFDLIYGTAFDNVTFVQEDTSTPYYIASVYTGDRTATDGKFIFDGVNLVITEQVWFECDVVFENNAIVKRSGDAKNFIYYGNVTIEPGSKFISQVDGISSGSALTIDGGRTDGTINATADYKTVWLYVDAGNTMTLKNGAYVVASNYEFTDLDLSGTVNMHDSRLDVFTSIKIGVNGVLKLNKNSVVKTGRIEGSGKIVIDGTGMTEGAVKALEGINMSGFTGAIELANADGYEAVIENGKLVLIKSVEPVAEVNGVGYETLQAAIAAAQAGDTVTVIADIADEAVTVDKNITITGSVSANNVTINAVTGCTELTVSGLSFTGNSWINSGAANKLTVSGVTANVNPSNTSATNSRSAFISLGRSEQHKLELVVENCNIVSKSGTDSILGWASITKATIKNNTFGSATAYQESGDAVKFMSIADGAVFDITGNTVYSNYNGIVFAQNTTRDNAYTVNIDGNTFLGGADHIWIEITGGDTVHATILATSNNTVNGNKFTTGDIKAHTGVIKNWTSFAGVDVVTNAEGKVIGGNIAFYAEDAIAEGYKVEADGSVVEDIKYVAEVDGVQYTTLEEAFKAATNGSVINILDDVVIDYKWDCRDYATGGSHSQFNESVTINGNGHTLKFTGTVNDNNWNTIFRFEENATVKNLIVDISEATGAQRVISAKKSLNVDELTIVGSAKYGVIFGEGSSAADLAATEITVTNSDLCGTRRAISDNEGGKDVKSVTITGNKLNANAYASAFESITFTNNTATGEVDLRSYTDNNKLNVTATGNTLNTEVKNYIKAGGTVDAQEEFEVYFVAVATIGEKKFATLEEAFAAAVDGDTITLLTDLTIESDLSNAAKGYFNIAADDKITLDLNGKTIDVTDNSKGNFIVFYNYGDLTIKNGTVNLTSTIDRDWNAQSTVILNRGGNLTVESGTYNHNGGTDMAFVVDNSGNSYGDALTTINGGTITTSYIGIRNRMDTYGANGGGNGIASLVINDGEISGKYAIWGQVSSTGVKGSIEINGGTFKGAEGKDAVLVDEDSTGEITTEISGGMFTSDVDALCAEGYAAIKNLDGFYVVGVTPELPTATVTKHYENKDLAFGLNFKADSVTAEQLAYYGDWYADFELTVNKDVTFNANGGANGYLSGQYDAWSENWVNVPFENVTLKAGESLKIMEYASKLMGKPGLKYTYAEVYEFVKDFNCGVFFEEDFLEANPDLKVTLELRMYNPKNESESYAIGDLREFVADDFKIPELPTATVTKHYENKDLAFGLNFKADSVTAEQLAYYGDWYADFELTVNKDVTFNANGGANGYLSGQYDGWSENWVNVPFENVTLKAGESLKIMEYASKLMGKPGLKYTYAEVYEFVKDFNCGVFFEEDFLEANPNLKVTLELRMYNPKNESESYAIGDLREFVADDFKFPEIPTATVTEVENKDLAFALNFKADSVTAEQLAYYGDWYADFELTVNKDVTFNANGGANGYLSGQYDGWSENWVNVPFENVTLEANKPLKIMEYASKLMGKPGLKLTYNDVYSFVKDFNCGVFFEEDFLAANSDLKVTLELRMYNPKKESESHVIGTTYTYDAEDFAIEYVAAIGEDKFTTLDDAITAAQAGDTITLLSDIALENTVTVPAGKEIVLDLAGKTISQTKEQTAGYQMILNDGSLTINDSVGGGKISYTDSGNGGEYISDTIYNRGTLVVNGGTIENLSSSTVATNGYPHAVDTYSGSRNTSVTINGGTVYCAEYSAIRMFCVSATNTADLTITGGTIKGAVDMQNGTAKAANGSLKVTGGTFETTKNTNNIRFANWNGGAAEYGITASIEGGTFNGGLTKAYVPTSANWNSKVVSGGTFDIKPEDEFAKEGYEFTANTEGKYEVTEKAKLFEFLGMNLDLESSMKANFYILASYFEGTDYYAKIVHSAATGDIVRIVDFADWEDNGSYKQISYTDLVAKNMSDIVTVTIFDGNDNQVSIDYVKSIKLYAESYIKANAGTGDKWVTPFVDMLNYGAAAQQYFGYNTENLANADIGDYQIYATQNDVEINSNVVKSPENVYGANLDLENKIVYNVYFANVTSDMTATFSYTDHLGNPIEESAALVPNGGYHQVSVDTLVIADANQIITVTVYDAEGNVHAFRSESINGYLSNAILGIPSFEPLARAMAKFTASAYTALHTEE